MTSIAASPTSRRFMGMPDPNTFANPWGPRTSTNFSGPAITAWGNVAGTMAQQPGNFARALGNIFGGYAYGLGNIASGYTGNYNAYAGGLGQAGANMANTYGAYGNTLGSLGNAAASGFGAYGNALGGMRNADASAFGAYGAGLGNNSAAAANALGSYGAGLAGLGQASANAYGANQNASAQAANALAGLYGGFGQGVAGLGNSFSNAFGGLSSGIGNIAQAMSNERSNRASASAMAEAARQGSVGNIGAAALGAYGSAANSALGAWAQNQSAYNNALSSMHSANQGALSNYGQSRNNALGSVAQSYANTASGVAPAAAVGDMTASFGGDFGGGGMGGPGFSADGVGGGIASGSFGGGNGGGGGGFFGNVSRSSDGSNVPGIANSAFGGLASTSGNIMDNSVLNALVSGGEGGLNRLDDQHYSSRAMPLAALSDVLGGMRTLGSDAYGESRAGMNQFYDATGGESDYAPLLGALQSQFSDVGSYMGRSLGALESGMRAPVASISEVAARPYQEPQSIGLALSGLSDGFGSTMSQIDSGRSDLGDGYAAYRNSGIPILGSLQRGYGQLGRTIGNAMNNAGLGFAGTMADQQRLAASMGEGFNTANENLSGVMGQLGSGFTAANEAVADLFDNAFSQPTPAELVRQEREAEMLRRQYQGQDAQQLLAEYAGREHAIPHDIATAAGLRWDSRGQRYYDPRNLGYTATEPPPPPGSPRPINPRGDTDPRVAHLFTPTPTRADHRARYRSTIWG